MGRTEKKKMKIYYVDRSVLDRIRQYEKEKRRQFNQMLSDAAIDKMGSLKFPVLSSFVHNDEEVRAIIQTGPSTIGLVDMPFDIFESLPFVFSSINVDLIGPLYQKRDEVDRTYDARYK